MFFPSPCPSGGRQHAGLPVGRFSHAWVPPLNVEFSYSTVNAVTDMHPVAVVESWADFVTRFEAPQVVSSKNGVGLFLATSFKPGGRRRQEDAEQVHALILDFDNGRTKPATGEKQRNETTVEPSLVEALLSGYMFVLATTHSHQPDWPRFRVVLPLANPVPAHRWGAVAPGLLRHLNLERLPEGALDPAYARAVQPYFWPSCSDSADFEFLRGDGVLLAATDGVIEDTPESDTTARREFTPEQVERYYLDRVPDLQPAGDREWKAPCPIHHGTNLKFYVNMQTGKWCCHSKCGGKGGGLYWFEARLKNLPIAEARRQVNAFLGIEETPEEPVDPVVDRIVAGPVDPDLYREIARQPRKRQSAYLRQLIALHQLDPDQASKFMALARKQIKEEARIIPFPGAAERLEQLQANLEHQLSQQDAERNPDRYGLALPKRKYHMDETGIFRVAKAKTGPDPNQAGFGYEVDRDDPVATRPFWPSASGQDITTGRMWTELSWRTSRGDLRQEWHDATITNSREALLKLDDAPVHLENVGAISRFMVCAKEHMCDPPHPVSTALGWLEIEDEMWLVLPGDERIEYIGPPLFGRHGRPGPWIEALRELVAWGPEAYPALTVICLSAASPCVRPLGRRNPLVGMVHESNAGKGTTIEFALSVWGDPRGMTVPAGSTGKGAQDRAIVAPDFPIFVDELQQMRKWDLRRVEDVIYFMANGQRRITSSRTQEVRGGERRYGVAFFAAEDDVFVALQRGAQNRVLELRERPLRDQALADTLAKGTRHYGQVGPLLAKLYNEQGSVMLAGVKAASADLLGKPGLSGDDAFNIGLTLQGAKVLTEATGVPIPIVGLRDYLTDRTGQARLEARDDRHDLWRLLIDMVLSAEWDSSRPGVLSEPGAWTAFRGPAAIEGERWPLEICPTAPRVMRLLGDRGHDERAARTWAERGWLARQGPNLKWTRTSKGKEGLGARVWRVTPAGLQAAGYEEAECSTS